MEKEKGAGGKLSHAMVAWALWYGSRYCHGDPRSIFVQQMCSVTASENGGPCCIPDAAHRGR